MILKKLKKEFEETLSETYPSEEAQSFFSILSEKHLRMSRLELALNAEMILSEVIINTYKEALNRLQRHEPIQYIIGDTEFYGLQFKVNPDTLIPRPETEELVDWICADSRKQSLESTKVLDIGTGSGCIAIALSKNIKGSKVSAIDFSKEALEVAKYNATFNNTNVDFICVDILKTNELTGSFDIIVSNPPYVRNSEKTDMQLNVLNYEPESALFVNDENPLIFYRKIASLAKEHLTTNGLLYFEINEYFSESIEVMLKEYNFINISVKKDFFGKHRMIKCSKNARLK